MKRCSKCKRELNMDCFGKLSSSPDGFKYNCKECIKEYNASVREQIKIKNKIYYENNKDTILSKSKIYREINKDTISLQRKGYRNREDVKEHIKMKQKEYLPIRKRNIKNKRQIDLNFRLSETLRSKLGRVLKGYNTSYTKTLGCDLCFLKKWLEYRFDCNMNWSNYGSYWHIDHILPINQFNFRNHNEKNICFYWTNLQPLHSKDNQSKSDKIMLHHYFNNIVSVFRFNKFHKQYLGYQTVNESLQWLRSKLRYGNNSLYDSGTIPLEIDNPQPSL